MMFDRRLLQNFDWILLLMLILIGSISIVNLYSATYPIQETGGSQIFLKQIYWFLIGFVVLLMMTTFDYHILERLAFPLYLFSLTLLILVLLTGKIHSGVQRWLSIGGITFQPSEFVKIAIVIMLAKYFYSHSYQRFGCVQNLFFSLRTAGPCHYYRFAKKIVFKCRPVVFVQMSPGMTGSAILSPSSRWGYHGTTSEYLFRLRADSYMKTVCLVNT